MSPDTSHFAQFGDFVFDLKQRVLIREGEIVPVAPKDLEVLLVLVRGCGQIVEKKQIIEKIWPDTFVEEANLSRHIFNLRRILSENGERSIETVPKRGYRFIAPIRFHAATPESVGGSLPHTWQATRAMENVQPISAQSSSKGASSPEGRSSVQSLPARQGMLRWRVLLVAASVFLATGAIFGLSRALAPHRVSIALRPIQNLTGDASKDYIAEGLTEELVTRIAPNHAALIVVPRSSAADVTGATAGPAPNASQAGYLLEGSLRESPGRFRITMKLVRLPQRELVWSREFDRPPSDLIGMQDEVSQAIVKLLPTREARGSDDSSAFATQQQ
jgi:DNA-binding winged helix-turn-helix (wHTH) protein/TolB-like protein